MHCINVMHSALAPGDDRGAAILIGGKRTLKIGDMLSSMLVPFMKMRTPEDWEELVALVRRIWEFWTDNALDHERVGEFIDRIGMGSFLDGVGIAPDPRMVREPRANSYIKFEEYAPSRLAGEPHETPKVLDKEVIGPEAGDDTSAASAKDTAGAETGEPQGGGG
jgi:dissimilatory sulfite reductase (desulfoviridin) alpha/beta subunit